MRARCRCWGCRRRTLAGVAPRLARAHDQLVAEARARSERLARARSDLLRAERLLAHRELQLLRASTTRDRRYVERRGHKLERAQRLVEHCRARVKAEDA